MTWRTGPGRFASPAIVAAATLLAGAGPVAAGDPPRPRTGTVAPLPPAVIDDSLTIAGEAIAATKVRTRMTVPVRLNGRGPYRFVVDSGADTSVVGRRVARALDLPAGTPVTLNAMTESGRVERAVVGALQLGPAVFSDLTLPVLKEEDLGGDGMIGIDTLVQQRLMLDFETRTIAVEDAARPPPRAAEGEVVVVARRRRGQLILTRVSANRKRIEAVIDTGSEITIGNRAMRDLLIRPDELARYTATVAVTGVTGATVNLQLARVDEIRLGAIVLRDVPVAFADVPPFALFGLDRQPALLLGTDLMEKFRRVSLDFRARKVRFQLRRCDPARIVTTMSYRTRIALADDRPAACAR